MKLLNKFACVIDNHHRRRTMAQFRAMPERLLVDCGISSELLALGVSAWPWRAPHETTQSPMRLSRRNLVSNRSDNISDQSAIPEPGSEQRYAA